MTNLSTVTGGDVRPAVPTLRGRAVRASIWTLGGYLGAQVLRLGGNVVLAALLAPEAFGLMALVLVFLQGLQLFSDTGLRPAIIHHARGEDPRFLNTAWTIQVGRGLVLYALGAALAAPVAAFYGQPVLLWLLLAAGLSNVFAGLNSTSLITLNRRLVLGKLTIVNLAVRAAQIVVTVIWALVHPSVWALAGGAVAAVALRTVASHTILSDGVRNRLHWDRDSGRMLFSFGKWVFLGTIVGYLATQLDRLVLGKLVTVQELGVYSIATVLAFQSQRVCEELSSQVLLPALASSARRERAGLASAVLRARHAILPAAVVMTVAVALLAPAFFDLLYTAAYRDAAWMAQLLCVPAWFMILSTTASKALYAVGDARSVTLAGLVRLVAGGAGCAMGMVWLGLPGFIVGFGLGAAAAQLVVQVLLARAGVGIVRQDVLYTLATAGLVGAGLAAGGLAAAALPATAPPVVGQLGAGGAVTAGAALWAWRRQRAAW